MSALVRFAKMIGVADDQGQDALADEERARRAVLLSRRGFFAAGATMAAAPLVPTRAYSFVFAPPPGAMSPWVVTPWALLPFMLPLLIARSR